VSKKREVRLKEQATHTDVQTHKHTDAHSHSLTHKHSLTHSHTNAHTLTPRTHSHTHTDTQTHRLAHKHITVKETRGKEQVHEVGKGGEDSVDDNEATDVLFFIVVLHAHEVEDEHADVVYDCRDRLDRMGEEGGEEGRGKR
jgi:hypothetical protein